MYSGPILIEDTYIVALMLIEDTHIGVLRGGARGQDYIGHVLYVKTAFTEPSQKLI